MKSFLIVVVVAALTVAAGGVWYFSGHQQGGSDASRSPLHASQMYHCPMHPTYTSEKPGECPICGMTLVPVEEPGGQHGQDSQADHGAAMVHEEMEMPPDRAAMHVTDAQRQMIGVKTAAVRPRDLTKEIRTVGVVAYDPTLAVAQREYIETLRTGDRSLAKAAAERLELLGMGAEGIAELRRTRRVQKNLYLPAPEGKAWIYGTIYEADLPSVKVGQVVKVSIPNVDAPPLTGTIAAIDPVLDEKTRSARVRTEVADPRGLLKPNLYVDVFLRTPLGEALTVPASALLWSEKASFVFVDEGKGRLAPRRVTVGARTAEFVQIAEGLRAGEVVVATPNFLIDAESQLRGTLEAMAGGSDGGHQHAH